MCWVMKISYFDSSLYMYFNVFINQTIVGIFFAYNDFSKFLGINCIF